VQEIVRAFSREPRVKPGEFAAIELWICRMRFLAASDAQSNR